MTEGVTGPEAGGVQLKLTEKRIFGRLLNDSHTHCRFPRFCLCPRTLELRSAGAAPVCEQRLGYRWRSYNKIVKIAIGQTGERGAEDVGQMSVKNRWTTGNGRDRWPCCIAHTNDHSFAPAGRCQKTEKQSLLATRFVAAPRPQCPRNHTSLIDRQTDASWYRSILLHCRIHTDQMTRPSVFSLHSSSPSGLPRHLSPFDSRTIAGFEVRQSISDCGASSPVVL